MKAQYLLILFFFILFNTNSTSQQKKVIHKNNSTYTTQKSKIEKIELKEQTRGTNRIITFTPDSKIISLNGEITTMPLSSDEWQKITKSASSIELSKISSLSSPTTDRYSDRALASTITIFSQGKKYTSSTFDSGNPPKELEILYKKLQ